MKNQKGITLIALVITIIVLLILAGVSIAMLTGDNGILTQSTKAKVTQIEGQVQEEVNLAVQSAKMYAEEKAVETPTGWLASSNLDTIKTEMEKDLTTAKGYTVAVNASTGVKVTYTTDSYKSATNNSSAKIEFTINIENNTFTINTPAYTPAHQQ